MNSKSPGEDLNQVAKDIREKGDRVALGGGTNRGPKSSGRRRTGTVSGPNVGGPGQTTKTGSKVEKVPASRVKLGRSTSTDNTSLTPDAVMKKIRSVYMRGLKACHKQLLKKDPSAGGKVRLKFRVGASGRVTRAAVKGFNPMVDACIQNRVSGWRFSPPKEDGEATDATFNITLQLQAN